MFGWRGALVQFWKALVDLVAGRRVGRAGIDAIPVDLARYTIGALDRQAIGRSRPAAGVAQRSRSVGIQRGFSEHRRSLPARTSHNTLSALGCLSLQHRR